MHHLIGMIVLGVLAGSASTQQVRPLLRAAVRRGLAGGRKLGEVTDSARTKWQDMVAEARKELDANRAEGVK